MEISYRYAYESGLPQCPQEYLAFGAHLNIRVFKLLLVVDT